jgi:hypothetical protein
MVIGFAIGATTWWRLERYLKNGKGIVMVLCTGTALIGGRLSGSWIEDIRDEQVVTGLVAIGALSALLGVPFCEGFLGLYRKMKRGVTK